MKTKSYIFITFLLFSSSFILLGQSGMTIQGGGAVTVNGNTSINAPCDPEPPTIGHVPSVTQIIWNWNGVIGATGYKWNLVNDYNTAIDVGMSTTKTENGLTCNTTYTRYAWAYSACGSSTALTLTQTTSVCPPPCGTPIIDARDGKTYNTVLIGTQCWFAQNLNVGTKELGSANQTNNSIIEKYCYNDDEINCNTYGGLYQWDEAMQYSTTEGVKGICPTGWHLPTDAEWTTLTIFLGGEAIAGGKMKSTSGWSSNGNGTNSSGFSALPGGGRSGNGYFYNLTYTAGFWSSSQFDASTAWYRYLYYYGENASRLNYSVTYGFSARCLRNN